MSFPDLLLLRHGETAWNAEGRLQGRLDSPLTSLGREQAEKQNDILRSLDLAGWSSFVSPQGRARTTAEIALKGIDPPVVVDRRLAEIDIGDWTGLTRDEISAASPAAFAEAAPLMWYDAAPGGEGYALLEKRCRAFLSDLDGPTIVVTHGITSRMLRVIAMADAAIGVADVPGGQGVVHRVSAGMHETLS